MVPFSVSMLLGGSVAFPSAISSRPCHVLNCNGVEDNCTDHSEPLFQRKSIVPAALCASAAAFAPARVTLYVRSALPAATLLANIWLKAAAFTLCRLPVPRYCGVAPE